MLTSQGYLTPNDPELKKKLTVRPVSPMEEFKLASFKVFKENEKKLVVPVHFGLENIGPASVDRRAEPTGASIKFVGKVKKNLFQDKAIDGFFETPSGGVLCLDVGFGKTVCALAIASRLGLRTMILVHKEFLANQWKERIQQFCPGSTVGIVQQDKCEIECDFVIGMIQTLSQRVFPPKAFESVGLLIVDEAHHIGARVFSQSMFKVCTKWTLGLTATPDRKDGLGHLLNWFMGPTYFVARRESQKGVEVRVINVEHEAGYNVPLNKFGKVSLPEMVTDLTENDTRNELIVHTIERLDTSRNLLVLSDRRAHCEWISSQIDGSSLYMGGMKREQLEQSEKARVIVATFSQAHEGLDIPKLDTILLTTPHSDVRQAIGRILREADGKVNHPLIIDFVDRISVLVPMYYRRRVIYKTQGFEIRDRHKDEAEETCAF
jgi:superfamily II DNA or RNA helicase